MNYKLKNEDIAKYNESNGYSFSKYLSPLINLANTYAQGTRPNVVGQMSELFSEFMNSCKSITIENWRRWYTERHPDAIKNATEKIYAKIEELKSLVDKIDKKIVENWVEDLIIYKTFNGLYVQKAILAFLAEEKGTAYRLADNLEEAKGIDGFVGDTPYSIKPHTYKVMSRLQESIDVKMIYYTKTKSDLIIDVED
jgi:hypothetical protein